MNGKKVALIICDGLGFSPKEEWNAVYQANTPNIDRFMSEYPHMLLEASGEAIGLPAGQMGTSEANHLIIGSGRILYQNLMKINRSIKSGEFAENGSLNLAIDNAIANGTTLHIMGLIGPGGVHAHESHIKAIVLAAKDKGLHRIAIHAFTDGRDTSPKSAEDQLSSLMSFLEENKIGRIASVSGRYWAMDRDNNADRVEKSFLAIVKGEGIMYEDPIRAIHDSYVNGITDEFIVPITIGNGEPPITVREGDSIVFANFRADRAVQITRRFSEEAIPGLVFVSMTKYADDLTIPVMFPPEEVKNTLSEVLSRAGAKQLRVTETDKFTHITFYFNAQKNEPDKGEERIMIPSNKDVPTHDKKPEMKAKEVASTICEGMKSGKYDFIAANIVNCDIVGHSGLMEPTIKAVEAVDTALYEIAKAAEESGFVVLITADHGNAEDMFNEKTGQPMTSHTTNPVPLMVLGAEGKKVTKEIGHLSDLAPTILSIMDIPVPKEMTGEVIIS